MNIFVKYNSEGQILSVTRVNRMPEGLKHPYAVDSEEGVEVWSIEPLGQFADKTLPDASRVVEHSVYTML